MKKIIYLGAILMMAMLASSAFAQDTMNSDSKMQKTAKNPDSKFMMMAATGGMNEIGLSNTALTKSSNEEVKQFAQKIIDDHTAANDELKTLAESKGVTLPAEMDAKHKAAMEKLSAMSSEMFDMEYVKMMVKDHEQAIALFQKEAKSGKDAEAKAFAEKTLPTLQSHLDMAKSMMSKMMNMKSDSKMKM